MPITNPQEKFVHALGLLYDAEQRFLEGQQQMMEQATDGELQGMLQTHIDESRQQVQNLEQVFGQMGQEPQRVTSDAAQGLVSDAQKSLQEAQEAGPLADTLIADAQAKVEHFEIACYRALVVGAKQMGQDEAVNLLQQNLRQEEQTAANIEQSTPKLVQKSMQSAASS